MLTAEKSSLNHIGAATLAAIEQIKNGTLPNMRLQQANQAAVVFVSGMPISDEILRSTERDSSLQKIIKNVENYENDQALLSEKLAKASVKALAFLPAKSWDKIREDSGLYTFHNQNANGTVNTSLKADSFADTLARKISKKEEVAHGDLLIPALILITSAVSQYFIVDKLFMLSGWWWALSFVAGTIMSMALFITSYSSFIGSASLALKKEIKSAGGLINMLWPDKTEPDHYRDDSRLRVNVKFPEAPEDVKQTLLKAYRAGIKTTLTTDASAICLETDVFALLLSKTKSEYKSVQDFKRELEARLQADPIIWVQEGSCVAFIAQYGDFPIEKAVIDKVLKENFLI